jgi:hypothetical protein
MYKFLSPFFLILFSTALFSQIPENALNIITVNGSPGSGCDVFYDGKYHSSSKDNGVYYFEYDSSKGSYNVTIKDNYEKFAKQFKFSFDKGKNDLPTHYLLLSVLAVTLDINEIKHGVQPLFDKYQEAGVTDVFVTVFSDGKTIFPTKVKGVTSSSRDYLKEIIEEGKKRNIRIRASLNALNWGIAIKNDPPFKEYLMVNKNGDFNQGEEGKSLFVSPAHPEVIRILSELVSEIAINYKDLYGINFNYMRYKKGSIENQVKEDFGFDKNTVELFQSVHQLDPYKIVPDQTEESPWLKWIEHKEDLIHNLIVKLVASIRDTNSSIIISSAIEPDYMINRGKDLICANPADWLNYIDGNNFIMNVEYKNFVDELRAVDLDKFFGFIYFRKKDIANEKVLQEFLKSAREKALDITLYLSDPSILDNPENRKALLNIMFRQPKGTSIN